MLSSSRLHLLRPFKKATKIKKKWFLRAQLHKKPHFDAKALLFSILSARGSLILISQIWGRLGSNPRAGRAAGCNPPVLCVQGSMGCDPIIPKHNHSPGKTGQSSFYSPLAIAGPGRSRGNVSDLENQDP